MLKTIDEDKNTCVEVLPIGASSKLDKKLHKAGIPFFIVQKDDYDGVPNVFLFKEIFIPNDNLEQFAKLDMG